MSGLTPTTPPDCSPKKASGALIALRQENWTMTKDDARKLAAIKLNEFSTAANSALQALNINLNKPVCFLSLTDGTVTLSKSHPDQERILQWLNEDEHALLQYKDLEMLHESIRKHCSSFCQSCDTPCFHLAITLGGPVAFFECTSETR